MAKKKDMFRDMDKERMLKATFEIHKVLDKFYDYENADSSDFSEIIMLLCKMVHISSMHSVFAMGGGEMPDEAVEKIVYEVIQTAGDAVKDISHEALLKCIKQVKMKKAFGDIMGFGMANQDLN